MRPRWILPLLVVALPACGSSPGVVVQDGAQSPAPTATTEPPPHLPSGDPSCDYTLSDYPGDCEAPPPIDAAVDLLAHYGPADYDDPDEIDRYLVLPGEEPVTCTYPALPNDEQVFYNRYDVYSRPGMHHAILSSIPGVVGSSRQDGCGERGVGAKLLAVLQGGIQGQAYHYPPSGTIAPENANIGTSLDAHQTIAYELHAVNPTDYPLLRESWTVFHTMPSEDVEVVAGQMAFNGGLQMDIPPHSRATITNTCPVSTDMGPIRVLDLFGHMHAHGERFSAFAVRKDDSGGETRELVYESYDWSELDLIEFNSITRNAAVTYEGGAEGGLSGDLELAPGESLAYECEMNNDEDYALRFKARAFDGEMCNLFGSFAPGKYWGCLGY